jgi:hypothetical protein
MADPDPDRKVMPPCWRIPLDGMILYVMQTEPLLCQFALSFVSAGPYKGPALLVSIARVSSSSISLVACSLKTPPSYQR